MCVWLCVYLYISLHYVYAESCFPVKNSTIGPGTPNARPATRNQPRRDYNDHEMSHKVIKPLSLPPSRYRILTLLNQRLASKHSVCHSNVSEYHGICVTKPCTALELEDIVKPGTFQILLCLQFMRSWFILWWPKNGIVGCSNLCEWNGAEMRGGCIANKWFWNGLASRR